MKIKRQTITLSQEVKRVAGHILDPHDRGHYVRTMFQAELDEQNYKNSRKRGRDDDRKTVAAPVVEPKDNTEVE